MENEFWSSLLTEKSWKILQDLRRKYDFILIGGWAVWLLTKMQKSKDIDIVIGINELDKLKQEKLGKNDKLKKYELKIEEIDVDIYLDYYSKLAIPVEDIKKYATSIEGFKCASPELLLILKQGAFEDRKYSVKGEKDKIDLMSLLFLSSIDFKKYREILDKYKLDFFADNLKKIVSGFRDFDLLDLKPREFKIRKKKILSSL